MELFSCNFLLLSKFTPSSTYLALNPM
ncbi:hypothetical protein ID866_9024 [Astraeus odoratus]|nr:hypothetical protein ID866_9024 [Astraeus odoratus]